MIFPPFWSSGDLPSDFPAIETYALTIDNVVNLSDPVTLPSGIVSGDLLLCIYGENLNPLHTTTYTAGWTPVFHDVANATAQISAIWKIADGSDSLTITKSAKAPWAATALRISGGSSVSGSAAAATSTTAPDFDPVSPGLAAHLVFVATNGDQAATMTAAPTGFGSIINNTVTFGGCTLACASGNFAASSIDPEASTNNSTVGVMATIAVTP